MARFAPLRRWILPVVVASQAVPVFALAPVLVLWLGYGPASKVAMAVLVIYFPVAAAFLDGLRRTDPGWLDLAQVMGAGGWSTLRWIRSSICSRIRVSTRTARIRQGSGRMLLRCVPCTKPPCASIRQPNWSP